MIIEEVELTEKDIEELRREAAVAGDLEQVELCNRALAGDTQAGRACIIAIMAARAQK